MANAHRALTVVVLVVVSAVASPAVQARHSQDSLPKLYPDEPVARAVAWFGTKPSGCAYEGGDPSRECYMLLEKHLARSLAAAGVDPSAWPSEDASLIDWLLARSNDTRGWYARNCNLDCPEMETKSLATSILAFSAGGVDPRAVPLPNGNGTRDYVADLLDHFTGGQFGAPYSIADDVWALIALNTVNYTSLETKSSARFIIANQWPHGGVSWAVGWPPRPDTTGTALAALAPREYPVFVKRALVYLENTQEETGPYRGCWDAGSPDTASTAWVINGLVAAREDPYRWRVDGQGPTACLLTFQADPPGSEAGSFKSGPDGAAGTAMPTYQALGALGWVPFGQSWTAAALETRTRTGEVGETIQVPAEDGFVRIGNTTHDPLEWTPEKQGSQFFHGLVWEPYPHPVNVSVEVGPGG